MRFFILLALCFASLSSPAQVTDTFLHGKWTVEKVMEDRGSRNKTQTPDSIKNSYTNSVFSFKPDKSCTFSNNLASMQIPDGVWKYDRDEKLIYICDAKNKETMQPVLMTIKVTNNLDGTAYFIMGESSYKLKVKNEWRDYMP